MRWQDGRRSRNVEDRRGGGGMPGGRAARVALPAGGGCVVIAAVVGIGLCVGASPTEILSVLAEVESAQGPPSQPRAPSPPPRSGRQDVEGDFVAAVLGDTELVWGALFQASGSRYPEPRLVLFDDLVQSACGRQSSATGPFYCPADQQVYLDTAFFDELSRKYGAPGDFAAAYVIAHEVGHHVQQVTGVSRQVYALKARASEVRRNELSVRQELQADCYAGIWAHHAHTRRRLLEEGDIEEGLRAAAAIGDDRLQRRSRGHVVPESFTHGTSQQRMHWFKLGLRTGDVGACDTFANPTP